MPWIGGAIAGGGALLGGLFGSNAASDAASTQAAAADRAAQLQKEMFDKQIALQEPFRQGGLAAQQRYLQLLGLTPGGAPAVRNEQQIRNTLMPQYLRQQSVDPGGYYRDVTVGDDVRREWVPPNPQAAEVGQGSMNDAIQAELARDAQAQQDYAAMQASPDFGKYARDFGMSDFQADPGYAFRMSEGLKALDRQAAARGGLISGAALKGAQRYGQEAASQEYTNAFNRYQTNRANQLQPLQSLMGASQTAANTLGNAAGNYAQGAGEAYMGAGNARASGYIGGANALSGAIGQGINAYQGQQFLNNMRYRPGGGYTPGGSYGSNLPDNIDIGGGFNPVLG